MKNNQKGITLVALVITIIVLLILAGVTIAALSGDNGILTRGSESKAKDEIGNAKDQINLAANLGIQEYFVGTHTKEEALTGAPTVGGKKTKQDYVEAYIDNIITTTTTVDSVTTKKIGNATVAFADHKYTLTSSDGKYGDEGTVNSDGSVTWKGVTKK